MIISPRSAELFSLSQHLATPSIPLLGVINIAVRLEAVLRQ